MTTSQEVVLLLKVLGMSFNLLLSHKIRNSQLVKIV